MTHRLIDTMLRRQNSEQRIAVLETRHCVVLAGPGSGKTTTLSLAMAQALTRVSEPRGIACITYNNECAGELRSRLSRLGVHASERVFIGTVHSFALSQVIAPYARCVMPELPSGFRVANDAERKAVIREAHAQLDLGPGNPLESWKYAETKRRNVVDRTSSDWRERNPQQGDFIETYENLLHAKGLIDFDDMSLLALRFVREHAWIRNALKAKFPEIFVDEYQDLGHGLNALVESLCFDAGARLFAVGDPDQSMYRFLGAHPALLSALAERHEVQSIQLRFNYRCGHKIIDASLAALGEHREYVGANDAHQGTIDFHPVDDGLDGQAAFIFSKLLPEIEGRGVARNEIAVLYRDAAHGDRLASFAQQEGVLVTRSDNSALIKRNSPLARFIESCARWVAGGWRSRDPRFAELVDDAVPLVYANSARDAERRQIEAELIHFLISAKRNSVVSTHRWLVALKDELIVGWQARARSPFSDWSEVDRLIDLTSPFPSHHADPPLAEFCGMVPNSLRVNLSTLHSAKGREFDAVIIYPMNVDVMPDWRETKKPEELAEARRKFYVGVTRARHELHLVYGRGLASPFVKELYKRTQS
jgi:DNA helicase-2/ATP-dependent DNA helicase PcrA